MLPSRISSTAVSIPAVLHICHRDHLPLSSLLILSAISIISERRYALSLAVVPCRCFPSPSPSLQPISPSPSSHIYSVAVPHLRHHARLPLSSPLTLSDIPIIPEQKYFLKLVVVPCQYFTSPSPFFQPIFPSPLSHISSVAVPHLLFHCIHTCCPESPPPCSPATVFTSEIIFHPYNP